MEKHGVVKRSAQKKRSDGDTDLVFWQKHEEKMIKSKESGKPGRVVAKVSYSAGATVNLGNYESLRVDVGVEVPCDTCDVPNTLDIVRKYVENELQRDVLHFREVGGLNG